MSTEATMSDVELADEIWKVNKDNGWDVTSESCWEKPRKIKSKLTLVHTEVSEAAESIRHDDKENFARELADIEIRILDICGGLRFVDEMDIDGAFLEPEPLAYALEGWDCKEAAMAALGGIHWRIAKAGCAIEEDDENDFMMEMSSALRLTRLLAKAYGTDLPATVQAVLEKNRQRGFRHGGKLL